VFQPTRHTSDDRRTQRKKKLAVQYSFSHYGDGVSIKINPEWDPTCHAHPGGADREAGAGWTLPCSMTRTWFCARSLKMKSVREPNRLSTHVQRPSGFVTGPTHQIQQCERRDFLLKTANLAGGTKLHASACLCARMGKMGCRELLSVA
jgi:hypothetical protein